MVSVSVLHQNERGIRKSLPDAQEISRDPRAEGMDFPIPPEFWCSTDILLIINSSTGMDQEIHPCGQGRIDSLKINPSLLRMRECLIHPQLKKKVSKIKPVRFNVIVMW